eukprot:9489987-Pyramimonas_sp.AAC.1
MRPFTPVVLSRSQPGAIAADAPRTDSGSTVLGLSNLSRRSGVAAQNVGMGKVGRQSALWLHQQFLCWCRWIVPRGGLQP